MAVDKASKPVIPASESPAEKFNLVTYFKEVRAELDKVQWPNRQQVISESAAVFLMVLVSALFIYLVDSLFHFLAGLLFT
ncbi:preprotein translocase subunit SecE [Anthocerotibacter panamensis]|uniref:preprotein translocase subunit SecE n=1 Tax=Anthocerotibacter panamensis TaxID=2857077 RepID=UPI001FD9190D|nr:preprotein translocase subunit SecE [Anthocerotibacter panamensis]